MLAHCAMHNCTIAQLHNFTIAQTQCLLVTNSGALECFPARLNPPPTDVGRTIFLLAMLKQKVSFALLRPDIILSWTVPVPIYRVFSETSIDQIGFYQGARDLVPEDQS